MKAWILALALAASGASAQAADLPKVGATPPVTEYTVELNRNVELRARLVEDRSGAAPVAVTKPIQLRFDLSLRTVDGGTPADLALTCRVALVGIDGSVTMVREGPCYTGTTSANGRWEAVGEPVKFRPNRYSAAGTAGVLVEVSTGKGRPKRVMATYGWAPEE